MEEACGVEKWFSIPFLLVKKHFMRAKVKALAYLKRFQSQAYLKR